MTDYVLALIPQYGLIVVFVVVTVASLGIPLPAAMLALASGGFAATGDLTLWQVIAVTLLSFILGDQIAYMIARKSGPKIVTKLKTYKRLGGLVGKGEQLLETRGSSAIIISRTIVSPAGPWVSYICGATGFKWHRFSISAFCGAACWTLAYILTGYYGVGHLPNISDGVMNMIGVVVAVLCVVLSIYLLKRAWKNR